MLRFSDDWMIVISSQETKALPWAGFETEGADAVLLVSTEKRWHFIEPTEILVGN